VGEKVGKTTEGGKEGGKVNWRHQNGEAHTEGVSQILVWEHGRRLG
jgi:hypothetical protein